MGMTSCIAESSHAAATIRLSRHPLPALSIANFRRAERRGRRPAPSAGAAGSETRAERGSRGERGRQAGREGCDILFGFLIELNELIEDRLELLRAVEKVLEAKALGLGG